ncbi:MAG: hypothetical protein ACRDHK_07990 [Actinomycetota bacterium]
MARNWRKGKLLKAAVGGTVVGLAGGATALASAAAADPNPVDAPSDDAVSLELDDDGTVQVNVDDEIVDDLDTTVDSPDTESVATPPGVETPASPQSADSPEDVDSPAAVDDQDSPADDDSPATVDTDDQGEDNDDQGEDESVDNDDESADSD